jgi:hypothetical protein
MATPWFPLWEYIQGNVAGPIVFWARLFIGFHPGQDFPEPSNFDEATFTGYAPVKLTMNVSNIQGDMGWQYIGAGDAFFQTGFGDIEGNTILGCYITTDEPGDVHRVAWYGTFPEARSMVNAGDFFSVNIGAAVLQQTIPA